jgi:hypothetical protein
LVKVNREDKNALQTPVSSLALKAMQKEGAGRAAYIKTS